MGRQRGSTAIKEQCLTKSAINAESRWKREDVALTIVILIDQRNPVLYKRAHNTEDRHVSRLFGKRVQLRSKVKA